MCPVSNAHLSHVRISSFGRRVACCVVLNFPLGDNHNQQSPKPNVEFSKLVAEHWGNHREDSTEHLLNDADRKQDRAVSALGQNLDPAVGNVEQWLQKIQLTRDQNQ